MNTIIFLSNRYVAAMEGTRRGKQVIVSRICSAQAPEGSIINGTVTEEEDFDRFFREFWEENGLARTNVTLVLGSAKAVSRQFFMPEMNHEKRMAYLMRELAGVERNPDPVLSYMRLGRENGRDRMLVNMADRSFLDSHIRRFREMKIHLKSVVMASTADILVFQECVCIRERTCVMQVLDGMSVLNILYVDGRYFQMNRHRLFGERGTPEFGMECAGCISNLQRFLDTQFQKQEIGRVYLLGEFEEPDVACCGEQMRRMMPGLQVERMESAMCGQVRFAQESDRQRFACVVALIGGMLVSGKKNNLLYQYVHDPVAERVRRANLRKGAAVALVLFLLIAQVFWQAAKWFRNAEEAEKQLALLGWMMEHGEAEAYDKRSEELERLRERKKELEQVVEAQESAVRYRPEVLLAVQECVEALAEGTDAPGAGSCQVEAAVQQFDGGRGVLVIRLVSRQEAGICRFAAKLAQEKELFAAVTYDGFVWDEGKGGWTAKIQGSLR